jgi:hypothetical protein
MSKQNLCPRCFIGVDNDGDGDCRLCANWSELKVVEARQSINQTVAKAVQIARDAAIQEIVFHLSVANDALGVRAVELFRRQYPKHGDLEQERAALAKKWYCLGQPRGESPGV